MTISIETTCKCCRCGIIKHIDDFALRTDRTGRRFTTCKVCVQLRNNAYGHTENGKASKRKYNISLRGRWFGKTRARNKQSEVISAMKSNAKYPDKTIARRLAVQALNNGELIKPQFCEQCGSDYKVQMHHDDYRKPLSVMWLCRLCHDKKHGKMLDIQEFPK